MRAEHIEVLVEELSMEAALRVLMPRIVGTTSFEVHSHQGKSDLLARLPSRLRGYASWVPATWRIVVIVDRDDEDCVALKARLEKLATEASLATRTASRGKYVVVNRVAVEELEAWYFGDWDAVRATYPRVPGSIPVRSRYRDPDAIAGGTWEALERVLQDTGYFQTGLAKIEAARLIAANMVPERNTSNSFQALRKALAEISGQQPIVTLVTPTSPSPRARP
jgi:hypothetical protein